MDGENLSLKIKEEEKEELQEAEETFLEGARLDALHFLEDLTEDWIRSYNPDKDEILERSIALAKLKASEIKSIEFLSNEYRIKFYFAIKNGMSFDIDHVHYSKEEVKIYYKASNYDETYEIRVLIKFSLESSEKTKKYEKEYYDEFIEIAKKYAEKKYEEAKKEYEDWKWTYEWLEGYLKEFQ